ncbi:glycosyltransferase family A protein [Acinetobacter soli]|uniref:glycosyltransferase family 2 protein n=1 Tax=Acinetobacter soli TaxID=487316 RepID=UPI002D809402|nr:glycosyltransferase family A protein [Acinetobacter soli]MEB4800908.1 glycosyltransferase family A protein [Acinetobacter soli]
MISIVVPVYNVQNYIKDCVESLINQDSKNFEVIFIDDCGTDNSMSILNQILSSNNLNYKIIEHSQNFGIAQARNTGLLYVNSEYIAFLDSDDLISSSFVSDICKVIEDNNEPDVIRFNYLRFKFLSDLEIFEKNNFLSIKEDKLLENMFNFKEKMYVSQNIYKTNLIKNHKFFLNSVYEDALWLPFIIKSASKIILIDKILYFYRHNPNSITNKLPKINQFISFVEGFENLDNSFKNIYKDEYLYYKYVWLRNITLDIASKANHNDIEIDEIFEKISKVIELKKIINLFFYSYEIKFILFIFLLKYFPRFYLKKFGSKNKN